MDSCQKGLIGVNLRMFEEKPSGIQNYIAGLFTTLLKKDKSHKYYFFSTGKKKLEKTASYIKVDSSFFKFLRRIDVRLVNIFFDNLYVLKLIKDYKVKIFLSPSFVLPLFKPKGVKYLTVIHDLSFLKYPHNPLRPYMNLVMYMKTIMPFVLKRADAIIVPSTFVKKELLRVYKVDPHKIKVIYEGKDNFFFQIKKKEEFMALQKKYQITDNYLFTTATNHERKNLYGLIKAFKNIREKERYQLVICGLLPDFTVENLKKYLQDLNLTNQVKFLGFIPKEDLRVLYSFAKLFIFPSFEEGFGLPILESSACGCLPICSKAGALPEVIGNQNLLFDPQKEESITKKIDEVLAWDNGKFNDYLNLTRQHTRQFNWKNAAEEYLEIFEKIC